MCSGDDNPPEVMSETQPVARKRHRCDECGLAILPGDRYRKTFGVWDGDQSTFRQHYECRALLEYISDVYCGGENWSFATLRDEVSEYTDRYETVYWGQPLACRMAAIEGRYGGTIDVIRERS